MEDEALERQLKREVREKEEEIDRLKAMIRDKKLAIESKKTFGTEDQPTSSFSKLTEEIDSVKLMVLNLKAA